MHGRGSREAHAPPRLHRPVDPAGGRRGHLPRRAGSPAVRRGPGRARTAAPAAAHRRRDRRRRGGRPGGRMDPDGGRGCHRGAHRDPDRHPGPPAVRRRRAARRAGRADPRETGWSSPGPTPIPNPATPTCTASSCSTATPTCRQPRSPPPPSPSNRRAPVSRVEIRRSTGQTSPPREEVCAMTMTPLVVDFAGELYEPDPDGVFVIGRSGDLGDRRQSLPAPPVHRDRGRPTGCGWVANVGSRLAAHLTDPARRPAHDARLGGAAAAGVPGDAAHVRGGLLLLRDPAQHPGDARGPLPLGRRATATPRSRRPR
jgi:hypothetical protein